MTLHSSAQRRPGFTLLELLVASAILVLAIAFLIPTMTNAHHHDSRLRCASNLHNIGIAMITYSNNFNQEFPRTYFDPNKASLDCSNMGGPAHPGPKPGDSFGPSSNVPSNCITASIFLLAKTEELGPSIFICNGTSASQGFTTNKLADFANFEDGNPWGQSMTYSFNCMFPGPGAVANGWRWGNSIADPTNFAIAADMNPGNANVGAYNLTNRVTAVTHTSCQRDMTQGNSNNHGNSGQQVLYADGHVQFQNSPFCGVEVVFSTTRTIPDNIYTARGTANTEQGTLGPTVFPLDAADCYLLPTDDANGF